MTKTKTNVKPADAPCKHCAELETSLEQTRRDLEQALLNLAEERERSAALLLSYPTPTPLHASSGARDKTIRAAAHAQQAVKDVLTATLSSLRNGRG